MLIISTPTYCTDSAIFSLDTCSEKEKSYSRPNLTLVLNGSSIDSYMATYNYHGEAEAYPYNAVFYIIVDQVCNAGHTF